MFDKKNIRVKNRDIKSKIKDQKYEIEDYEAENKEQDFSVQKIRNLVNFLNSYFDFVFF